MATVANKANPADVIDTHIPTPSKSVITLADGVTAPDTKANYTQLYVDSADGDLKAKFGDGTTKVVSADT